MKQAKRQAVRVDVAALEAVVRDILTDIVTTLQGPENGVEDEASYGLEQERLSLYEFVERVGRRGTSRVYDLLVYDLVGIPLVAFSEHEPGWYLTVSLNADVRKG